MKVIYYHYLAIAAYLSLFVLLMAWNIVLAPSKYFPVGLVLLFMVTPLLLPLRGLLKGAKKACSWAAYVSLLYFVHGTQEAFVNPDERFLAWIEIVLSLCVFFGTSFYVRLSGKAEQ